VSTDATTPDDDFKDLLEEYQEAVDSGDVAKVEHVVHDFFALAENWCNENPSPELELTILASNCENNADWSSAESAYRQVLALPALEPIQQSKARSDLAALYRLLSRDADALTEAHRATAAARHADIPVWLAMTLRHEARCLIQCGQFDQARSVIDEALAVVDADEAYNQIRASILTLRAECAIHAGQLADAKGDLEQSFPLLQPLSAMEFAAGIHRDLARWWSAAAILRAAREDAEGAVDAWRKAVSVARHVATLPQTENVYAKATVADMLSGLAQALMVAGRQTDAEAAIAERRAILVRLGLPADGAAHDETA